MHFWIWCDERRQGSFFPLCIYSVMLPTFLPIRLSMCFLSKISWHCTCVFLSGFSVLFLNPCIPTPVVHYRDCRSFTLQGWNEICELLKFVPFYYYGCFRSYKFPNKCCNQLSVMKSNPPKPSWKFDWHYIGSPDDLRIIQPQ